MSSRTTSTSSSSSATSLSSLPSSSSHHYAFDAVSLLDDCIDKLQLTIDRDIHCQHIALYDMKQSLINTERILHHHLLHVLEVELRNDDDESFVNTNNAILNEAQTQTLAMTVETLDRILQEKKRRKEGEEEGAANCDNGSRTMHNNPQSPPVVNKRQDKYCHFPSQSRSATDTLLFRLIVTLQLCLVRIDDAHMIITGRRLAKTRPNHHHQSRATIASSTTTGSMGWSPLLAATAVGFVVALGTVGTITAINVISSSSSSSSRPNQPQQPGGVTSYSKALVIPILSTFQKTYQYVKGDNSSNKHAGNNNHQGNILAIKLGVAVVAARWVTNKWNTIWMTDKIVRSTMAIDEWQQKWSCVFSTTNSNHTMGGQQQQQQQHLLHQQQQNEKQMQSQPVELLDAKSRRLIEFAMKENNQSSFWQSQGEMRFLMLKRAMDVFYASVGTAIKSIDVDGKNPATSTWQVPLVTAAAASFYSLTGASKQALNVVNSSSRDLIQHAWGMVSLPAIKTLMLQASRLMKGAAVADRFEIAGVPCFILSRAPAPELAAALKRQHRQSSARRPSSTFLSKLSTISESQEVSPYKTCASTKRKFVGSGGRYRQRDVILHLTGGGFFAHTIASDLPYLLDWSAATGAVVICPEYALLPDHTFPVALNQIANVYSALVDGDAASQLGFETNRIVVTGESAGGNLAASLCVMLGMHILADAEEEPCDTNASGQMDADSWNGDSVDDIEEDSKDNEMRTTTKMPDAMMLSCAALNLSLELSYSRVIGTEDPVLPSGLIKCISDAYLPPQKGLSKQDPLASPFFAPNEVLALFPPTLLFAGSKDPLLDDSVGFNKRLRDAGVRSELRAAHNVPHAYWGLGTAGFPEAQQVQRECEEWLTCQIGLQS